MDGVFFVAIVFFIGAAAFGWFASEEGKVRRELRDMPRTPIASYVEGYPARVVGRIVQGPVIEAPISGRPCVYFEVVVQERSNDSWSTIVREANGIAFMIDDGTGRAYVEPNHARVAINDDVRVESGGFWDETANPRQLAFLARHGKSNQGWIFEKDLRYREGILEPGETVAIAGQGVREPDLSADAAGDYRSGPPTLLRMNGWAKHPLLISDKPDAMS